MNFTNFYIIQVIIATAKFNYINLPEIYLNNKEKDSGVHFRCPLNVAVN